MERVKHEFEPVFDANAKILILGTLPSVKSRENGFYYGHPRNRFWKVLAMIFQSPVPDSIEAKKQFLLENKIAIWDVIESCDIENSADSSICNVIPTDLTRVLKSAPIERIYANGSKAYELYMRYSYEKTSRKIIKLPSTSPANAAYHLEDLVRLWQEAGVTGKK